MSQNRRKYHRVPIGVDAATATLRGSEFGVDVIDQSIDGLRIGGLPLDRLSVGERIEVDVDGEQILGRTRCIARVDERRYEIGIQREDFIDEESPDDGNLLLVSFIHFQERWICCQIVEDIDDSWIRIELPDGKRFQVARTVLFQLTESERREMLRDEKEFFGATEFYQFMVPHLVWDTIDQVVRFEFQKKI